MCSPMAAIQVAGMALSVYSENQKSKAAEGQARHVADVARFNQQVYNMRANSEIQAAEYEADLLDEGVRRNLARNRALAAMSGVVINTGSVDQVQQDSLENAAMERLAILYNGNVRAHAARTGALNYGMQATGALASAGAERAAGQINTGVRIAEGAYTLQQRGLLD